MNRNHFWSAVALGLSVMLAAFQTIATASTVLKMSVEELTEKSTYIARGGVVSSRSEWIDHRICTITTIAVSDCYKGDLGERVEITQLGGTIGRLTTRAPGRVAFEDGEDVLVFIFKNKRGMNMISGLGQGKYRVFTDKKTGRLMLRSELGAIKMVDPHNPYPYRTDDKSRRRRSRKARKAITNVVPFDRFVGRVKDVVRTSERRRGK